MSQVSQTKSEPKLDLSKWAGLPLKLIIGGAIACLIVLIVDPKQFLFSYLTGFMFFLSIVLGSLFLVLLHHLFDSYWLVPIRRFLEHISCLVPVMAGLFIPIAIGAFVIYPWMTADPNADHALHVKAIMYNPVMFYVMAVVLFGVWYWLTKSLRDGSLAQDQDGAAEHTIRMRKLAAGGIFIFAFTLTLGAFYWMKSLEYQWFSTMYGVYYFAGSVWTTLATTYIIALVLKRTGHLAPIIQKKTFHDCGVLFFAFTVFYAYIHFSQYFLIWNAAIPEETFWYARRENGVWWEVGLLIIFGHFFVPFVYLLRIDTKLYLPTMIPICIWAWVMHYLDMTFNIKPVINPDGAILNWSSLLADLGSLAFMGGVMAHFFLRDFLAHPPFPQRDPRVAETMGVYVEPLSVSEGEAK